MTDFIISEEELVWACNGGLTTGEEEHVRSRPAPAPEAMITEFNKRMGSGQTINQNDPDCGVQFTVQQLKEHDTAIATQAREQVLDELSEFNSNEYLRRNGRCGFFEVFTNWKTKMESLREAQR
jgi:hypothetical protein